MDQRRGLLRRRLRLRMSDSDVPETASEHPTTWTFGYPIYHPADLAAWRSWLIANHEHERGAWVAAWRPPSGRDRVPYAELVEESICFGWIDSTVNILDEDRNLQLMTPRKPKSSWTRLNRRRVEAMEEQGRMTDAGLRAVAVAQANGWWTRYEAVEDLIEPDDLAAALDASPVARSTWDGLSPSARKQLLWTVISVERPDTRARRIATIVADAEAAPSADT